MKVKLLKFETAEEFEKELANLQKDWKGQTIHEIMPAEYTETPTDKFLITAKKLTGVFVFYKQ